MNRHEQAMMESVMTPEQALTFSERYKRFTRCWRIEKSLAGASRLVTRKKARELQAKYGGEIVRVVDAMPHTMTAAEFAALGLGACDRCNANPGEPCVSRTGHPRKPHRSRK